jgi:hypothetical protein
LLVLLLLLLLLLLIEMLQLLLLRWRHPILLLRELLITLHPRRLSWSILRRRRLMRKHFPHYSRLRIQRTDNGSCHA